MSATNRGAERLPDDFYETPTSAVRALTRAVDLPGGNWIEPSAGHGAIIRAVNRSDVNWTAVEIREEARPHLANLVRPTELKVGVDFLAAPWTPDRSVAIGNPPFSLAMEFIKHALPIAQWVALLLRLNFLGSIKRAKFFRSEMPDVHVLESRPSFAQSVSCARKKQGCDFHVTLPLDVPAPRVCPKCAAKTKITTSDATEYAWFLWTPERGRRIGNVSVLDCEGA